MRVEDVATQAGIARGTASAILNGRWEKAAISQKTAERVLKVADQMGYVRSRVSMTMKTGESMEIGWWSGSLEKPWVAEVLKGSSNFINSSRYTMKLVSERAESENCIESIKQLIAHRISALFCCNIYPPPAIKKEIKKLLTQNNILVISNNSAQDLSPYVVEVDNTRAVHMALAHLKDLGHQEVAYLGATEYTADQRNAAFISGVEACGLRTQSDWMLQFDWDLNLGREKVHDLFSTTGKRPTALIAVHDESALAAMSELQRMGFRIPEDVAVIGITNGGWSAHTNPSLTTVATQEEIVGYEAMKLGTRILEGNFKKKSHKRRIKPELIVRGSTLPS
jgi:DNA-binding LacI/PurR family transcriptional regulator